MRCIERRVVYASRADVFRLYFLGDIHLGNRSTRERDLTQLVNEVIAPDPNAYWLGLGDYCDCINLHDPRFDPTELAGWLYADRGRSLADIGRAESRRFCELVTPIRDRCLGLVSGNHEDMILQHSEADVYGALVEALADGANEHRLDHRGFINWRFQRTDAGGTWTLRLHATHGSNGGRRPGGTANRLTDIAGGIDGVDVVVQGHTHRAMYDPIAKFRPGRKESETAVVHCINIPPMCADMRYAERLDLPAVPTGYTMLEIAPDKKQVTVSTRIW